MKRLLLVMAGMCWILFALGFALFLVRYISEGAGLQLYIPMVSSGSVLLGLVHVVGLCLASFICFAVGCGLMARGIVADSQRRQPPGEE
jgi:hypothetical protein